ncbi:hypothetical protein EAG_12786 [Camponotus floridanus]|uniref:Uncharacterized protein n=1 Tax=Camponotus floridanus TaxID=104421 RepID=E2A5U7_CAMFO|nr:hypothetical protein EAG_12786 [Camponotus floridanus]
MVRMAGWLASTATQLVTQPTVPREPRNAHVGHAMAQQETSADHGGRAAPRDKMGSTKRPRGRPVAHENVVVMDADHGQKQQKGNGGYPLDGLKAEEYCYLQR